MILDGYHQYLMRRVAAGTTTLRSVRLALSPAAALLMFAETMDRIPPDRKALDGFLRQAPGRRAAPSGLVKYLREKHCADIALPKRDSGRAYRMRHRKLEAEMLALMQEGRKGGKMEPRWLGVALAYFHDLPVKTGEKVKDEDVTADESGIDRAGSRKQLLDSCSSLHELTLFTVGQSWKANSTDDFSVIDPWDAPHLARQQGLKSGKLRVGQPEVVFGHEEPPACPRISLL